MKTIGIIGGMSWESSLVYYRLINERVKARLGGLHSARCILYSVDFAEVEALQRDARWDEAGQLMAAAARSLERAGADLLLIATNTMHKLAGPVQAAAGLPLLHIADPTAECARAAGIATIGLLGTRFTMEEDFYRARLEQHGLRVVTPDEDGRALVHAVIYDELCLGITRAASKQAFINVINRLAERGAQGVILGCTEIGLLVSQNDTALPLFDTTRIHAEAAVDAALD